MVIIIKMNYSMSGKKIMHAPRVRAALTRSLNYNSIGDAGACGIGKGLASNTALQYLEYVACRCRLHIAIVCLFYHYVQENNCLIIC